MSQKGEFKVLEEAYVQAQPRKQIAHCQGRCYALISHP